MGPGFATVDCSAVVANELQAEFIYEHGQLREPVPHTPAHSGRSPRVVAVAQEVDWLMVLPGDGTQSSLAPEFVPAMFGQPPAEFLGVVLAAWHDGTRGQDSQLLLQQVEERDGVVKAVHEQHVVLVGDLRVLHETAEQHCWLIQGGASGGPRPGPCRFLHRECSSSWPRTAGSS